MSVRHVNFSYVIALNVDIFLLFWNTAVLNENFSNWRQCTTSETYLFKKNENIIFKHNVKVFHESLFCGVFHLQKVLSFISSQGYCRIFLLSHTFDMPRARFQPAQDLNWNRVYWSCAVMITTTPRSFIWYSQMLTNLYTKRIIDAYCLPIQKLDTFLYNLSPSTCLCTIYGSFLVK